MTVVIPMYREEKETESRRGKVISQLLPLFPQKGEGSYGIGRMRRVMLLMIILSPVLHLHNNNLIDSIISSTLYSSLGNRDHHSYPFRENHMHREVR